MEKQRMTNDTKKTPLAYLSGAMEGAPDHGRAWRQQVKEFLHNELGHQVFDPTDNINRVLSPEEKDHFREWKISDPDKFYPVIHRIIDRDLEALLTKSDYVICFWDEHVCRGAGTAGEITLAYHNKIPVYFITELPLGDISSWAVGCASRVFSSFNLFFDFAREHFGSSDS
jgi:hypothetical protein